MYFLTSAKKYWSKRKSNLYHWVLSNRKNAKKDKLSQVFLDLCSNQKKSEIRHKLKNFFRFSRPYNDFFLQIWRRNIYNNFYPFLSLHGKLIISYRFLLSKVIIDLQNTKHIRKKVTRINVASSPSKNITLYPIMFIWADTSGIQYEDRSKKLVLGTVINTRKNHHIVLEITYQ